MVVIRGVRGRPVAVNGLDMIMVERLGLGTMNVRGGLAGNSGKLEALVQRAADLELGVLAIQETATMGVERRICLDDKGAEWTLCTGGPASGPKVQGTGFLVSPKYLHCRAV